MFDLLLHALLIRSELIRVTSFLTTQINCSIIYMKGDMWNVCTMRLGHGDFLIILTVNGRNHSFAFPQSPIELLAIGEWFNQEQTKCSDNSILNAYSLNKECYPTYSGLDSWTDYLVNKGCRIFVSKKLPEIYESKGWIPPLLPNPLSFTPQKGCFFFSLSGLTGFILFVSFCNKK